MSTTMPPNRRGMYWEEFSPAAARSGADLAALRRGLGQEPGSVPELWRFHRASISSYEADSGELSPNLAAEHAALTLFALHQQSQRQPMHHRDIALGAALRRLRASDPYKNSPEALDTRVNVMATSGDVPELVNHLRGLVTLLRRSGQPLDYTRLYYDVRDWHFPERQDRVRRRWGAQYYDWAGTAKPEPKHATA